MPNNKELTLRELIRLLKQRRLLLLGTIAAALAVTIALMVFLPTVYRGETTLTLAKDSANAKEVIDAVGSLKQERLRIILPQHANQIHSLSVTELKGATDKLRVVIDTEKRDELAATIDELMGYLSGIALLRHPVEEQRALVKKQIDELTKAVAQAEAAQASLEKGSSVGRSLVFFGFNPAELGKRISEYRIERFSLQQKLQNLVPVKMADQIYQPPRPQWPHPLRELVAGAAIGLILGLILVFLTESLKEPGGK